MKPLLLDLFSCAGGAGYGYHQAGFEVVGVDLAPQPHYPFTFYQGDALVVLDTLLADQEWNGYTLASFQAIHASPECKAYTQCNLSPRANYEMLIGPVRQRLARTGKPWIIENVEGASAHMRQPLVLCATMFGLPMKRHRLFESNTPLEAPAAGCDHSRAHIGVYAHSVWDSWKVGTTRKDGRVRPGTVPLAVGRAAMGITWMNRDELAEAIPPAYTYHLGLQLKIFI